MDVTILSLFPEMFSCGYALYDNPEKMKAAAIASASGLAASI